MATLHERFVVQHTLDLPRTLRELDLANTGLSCAHYTARVLSGRHSEFWDTSEYMMNNLSGMTADVHGNSGAALRSLLQYQPPAAIANPRVHGYIVSISFGLMLPLSILISRSFKEYHPHWFHIHRVLGLAAWIVGVIGASFGQAILSSNPIPSYHQILGWMVVALSTLQISAIAFRPPLEHNYRWLWATFHHWSGRIGVAFAISNVYTGIHLAGEANKFYWGYSIILGTIVLVGFCKEIIDIYHLGIMDHTSIIAKVSKIKLMEEEEEEDIENPADIEPKRRRSSLSGPQDGGFMFRNSQEYRHSVEMRRASVDGDKSDDRPRRSSLSGPQDGGFVFRKSVEHRRSAEISQAFRAANPQSGAAPRRLSLDGPEDGGFIFRLSAEHRRSVEMRRASQENHLVQETGTHHLSVSVPENASVH